MTVEVLYFEGCPSHGVRSRYDPARYAGLLDELVLDHQAVPSWETEAVAAGG